MSDFRPACQAIQQSTQSRNGIDFRRKAQRTEFAAIQAPNSETIAKKAHLSSGARRKPKPSAAENKQPPLFKRASSAKIDSRCKTTSAVKTPKSPKYATLVELPSFFWLSFLVPLYFRCAFCRANKTPRKKEDCKTEGEEKLIRFRHSFASSRNSIRFDFFLIFALFAASQNWL